MVIGRQKNKGGFDYTGMIRRKGQEVWIKAECAPGTHFLYVKIFLKKNFHLKFF